MTRLCTNLPRAAFLSRSARSSAGFAGKSRHDVARTCKVRRSLHRGSRHESAIRPDPALSDLPRGV